MTRFRPCIDLHEGKVKQIVGSTLRDGQERPKENFVSSQGAAWFAELYKKDNLLGGHVIMLGSGNEDAAIQALSAYPEGLQIGGGIHAGNAQKYIDAGASHVIVTSSVFESDGTFSERKLEGIASVVGKERLVLDLSCKATATGWQVAMNRWQLLTDLPVNADTMARLSPYCEEFLIHAVDVEGKCEGIDKQLVTKLADWSSIPVTYAGGARSLNDLEQVQRLSDGRVDVTIGSALDIFGGSGVKYADCVEFNRR